MSGKNAHNSNNKSYMTNMATVAATATVMVMSSTSVNGLVTSDLKFLGDATNLDGDLQWGDCIHNHYSKAQCPGAGFTTCSQKYAFPYYYYDRILQFGDKAVDTTGMTGDKIESLAMDKAQQLCENPTVVPEADWEATFMNKDLTLQDIASLFVSVNPTKKDDCAGALVIVSGECQASAGGAQGQPIPSCLKNVLIWQNGNSADASPIVSAKNLYDGNYSLEYLCNSDDKVIPDGWISAGNSNFIGAFCHMNKWQSGFGYGGGQCSGGLNSDN